MKSLDVRSISKAFGATQALQNVSLTFKGGEVHAVLGENGAGKSTLVSVIAGFLKPDSGSIVSDGEELPLGQPHLTRQMGVAMVHQHFTLAPSLSAAENYTLGHLTKLGCLVNPRKKEAELKSRATEMNWSISAREKASALPVGMQQRLEILKNIGSNSEVLIFDEPTAVLTQDESAELLQSLRHFSASGKVVILIAHKLSEVLSVADQISVLRKGVLIGSVNRSEATSENLAEMMLGEPPRFDKVQTELNLSEGLRLDSVSVLGDAKNRAITNLSLEIRRGEIVGIGGVDGNGQYELSEAVTGVRKIKSGQIRFAGKINPVLAYIPGDRRAEGLALSLTLWENLLIGKKRGDGVHDGYLNLKVIRSWARNLLTKFQVKALGERDLASSLSGGNQQKVVVARELDRNPELIVALNPTRGLDIKASEFVRSSLLKASNDGAAVLLISTDLDELAEVADRVHFLQGGRLSEPSDIKAMVSQ